MTDRILTMKLSFATALTLAAASAHAEPPTNIAFRDVRHAPQHFLNVVTETLLELAASRGLEDQVDDIVVVGSYAYGIARHRDTTTVSDLDVVLYMRALSQDPAKYLEGFAAFREAIARYRVILQQRLNTTLGFDIKIDSRNVRDHIADPDWVGYSLLHRRFYNRPDGAPRLVKGYFYQDVYYVFDRAEYLTFLAAFNRDPRPYAEVLEGNQLVFYDRAAWDRGEKVELLRSWPKHKGKLSAPERSR